MLKRQDFTPEMSRNQGLEATLSFGVPPNRKVPCSWGFRASGRTKKGRNESLELFEKVGAKMSPAWPGRAREGRGADGGDLTSIWCTFHMRGQFIGLGGANKLTNELTNQLNNERTHQRMDLLRNKLHN